MSSVKARKVVSTVKRGPASTDAPASVRATRNTRAKAVAKASRKTALAPLVKKKVAAVSVPVIKREQPHILKSTEGKPLVERLNDRLLEQLRTRRVTNEEAAALLNVHPTYLSRTLRELGQEKEKGKTMEHREARSQLADAREKFCAQLAKQVNRGEKTAEKAAREPTCTLRTMSRWCAKYATIKK